MSAPDATAAVSTEQTNPRKVYRLLKNHQAFTSLIDGARQGATHLEGRAVLLLSGLESTQCGVRDIEPSVAGLTFTRTYSVPGTTNVEVGVGRTHRGPLTSRRISWRSHRPGPCRCSSRHPGRHAFRTRTHARRQSVSNVHARGNCRASLPSGPPCTACSRLGMTSSDSTVSMAPLSRTGSSFIAPSNRLQFGRRRRRVDADLGACWAAGRHLSWSR